MKICVIGTGYVGLVTGTCLSSKENQVICVDNDLAKLEILRKGQTPIYEPGLSDLMTESISRGKLSFTDDVIQAVKQSEIVFMCLPTPPKADGSADLSFILSVAENIANSLNPQTIIVNKSTVPVGTAQKVNQVISSKTDVEVHVVSNPEFLREGTAVSDFLNPERVVIGSSNKFAQEKMRQLYTDFVDDPDTQIVALDTKSSEVSKYAANSFLALKISFINEIADLCSAVGADVRDVAKSIGMDSRIGPKFLRAGIGYGGSCFPKDVLALRHSAEEVGVSLSLLDSLIDVNEHRVPNFIQKITHKLPANNQTVIGVWGLTFKADTDDVRESPAIKIVKELLSLGYQVKVYDPKGMEPAQKFNPELEVTYCHSAADVLDGVEGLVTLTEWSEFKNFPVNILNQKLAGKVLFDGRNMFSSEFIDSLECDYVGVGFSNL
jgi:UDPglucose 6-dehydrogenase